MERGSLEDFIKKNHVSPDPLFDSTLKFINSYEIALDEIIFIQKIFSIETSKQKIIFLIRNFIYMLQILVQQKRSIVITLHKLWSKQHVVLVNDRPKLTSNLALNEHLKNLITRCWSGEPQKRSTFSDICDLLVSNDFFIKDIDKNLFDSYINYLDSFPEIKARINTRFGS